MHAPPPVNASSGPLTLSTLQPLSAPVNTLLLGFKTYHPITHRRQSHGSTCNTRKCVLTTRWTGRYTSARSPASCPTPTHTVHESCGLCMQHFCRQRHHSTTVTLTSNSTDRQQVRTCVCVNVRVQTKWSTQCDDPSEWNRKNPNLAPLDQCIPTTSDRLKVATQFAGQCLTKVSRRAVKR